MVAILLCSDFKQKARNGHSSIPDMRTEEAVPRLHCPSLQYFRKHYLVPQRPVILEGVANHWPCMKKWRWVAAESQKVLPPIVASPKTPCTLPPPPPSKHSPWTRHYQSLGWVAKEKELAANALDLHQI